MRTAVIDLGSNTFHLIIAEYKGNELEILYKTNIPVKLSEGRINENLIIPAAFERGIAALKEFDRTIQTYQATQIKATATSAIRSAKNGQDFVDRAKNEANINIDTISGDEEAELIYKGVNLSGAISDKSLIIDIGGGSVEFILCDTEQLLWKKSYNIGAARLTQQFFHSNPLSESDTLAILNHLDNELEDLFKVCAKHLPLNLIGSAGAFETFAQLILAKNNQDLSLNDLKTYAFDLEDYLNITKYLLNATHDERAKMPGMIPLRVDMCVMASLITNFVIGKLNINNLTLSTYDLKMGVLASMTKL